MCYDRNDNTALLASLIGNRNSDAAFNQWNNPFMYLVWLSLSRNGGFGCEGNSSRLDEISTRLNTNQNTTLMMDAINGNHEALHALATNVGVSSSQLQGAICGVQNAITQVAGQVGFSAEKVINAVLMGNKDLTAAIQNCCCNTQQSILKMGYENQLATERQTAQVQERFTGIANGIQQGFASTAYEAQRHACDIVNAIKEDGQATRALLQGHWQFETDQALRDAKAEILQLKNNQTLINEFKDGFAGGFGFRN